MVVATSVETLPLPTILIDAGALTDDGVVFVTGDETGFLVGDVVLVFRTPVTAALLSFETVDVRFATGLVVFTAVVVLVVAVAVVVLGAAA